MVAALMPLCSGFLIKQASKEDKPTTVRQSTRASLFSNVFGLSTFDPVLFHAPATTKAAPMLTGINPTSPQMD